MKNSYCRYCKTRHVNCHATCEKYAAYREMINSISLVRQKEMEKDALAIQRFVKSRDVLIDKKKHGRRWTLA